ncbi:DUF302 domain-containing protein [Natronogracilivirga saccharolytica]|uniref:DUF302 domain-containing protein n=1 Tax=Natronogracilivirga saccharolytica TaxID=2812953 RepID=A0A8J7RKD9_9BACT|nr:DUF302 domain-containing protein [Natronogracilivirga saccharolytica]MBP3191763.1 DUF302 domain-containing protein [Natronogracilivirga saccharolytica]
MIKNTALFTFSGALFALIFSGIFAFSSTDDHILMEDRSRFDFDTTIEQIEKKVDDAGWGIVNVHDMKSTLAGHGHDVQNIQILELCSSHYAARILELDDERIISPLMPCRIAVYEKSNGNTYISRMDNEAIARSFSGVIEDVMARATSEIEDIITEVIE